MEEPIPNGWRLHGVDASMEGRYSVMLVRDERGKKAWLTLSEEHQDKISLYASGNSTTLEGAVLEAIRDIGGENERT